MARERIGFDFHARELPKFVGAPIPEVRVEAHRLAEREGLGVVADTGHAQLILRHPRSRASAALEIDKTYLFLGDEVTTVVTHGMEEIEEIPHLHVEYRFWKKPHKHVWGHEHGLQTLRPFDLVMFARAKKRKQP